MYGLELVEDQRARLEAKLAALDGLLDPPAPEVPHGAHRTHINLVFTQR
jgi:hypothetical protein